MGKNEDTSLNYPDFLKEFDCVHDLWMGVLDVNIEGMANCVHIRMSRGIGYCVEKNGKVGVVSLSGNLLVPCEYDRILANYSVSGFYLCRDGKWGFVSKSRNIPCIYDFVLVFSANHSEILGGGSEWLVLVSLNGELLVLDKQGFLHQWPYSHCGDLRYNRACVYGKNGYGYIDENLIEVIPCKYEFATDFKNGKARVVQLLDRTHRDIKTIDTYGNVVPNDKEYYTLALREEELQASEELSYKSPIRYWPKPSC